MNAMALTGMTGAKGTLSLLPLRSFWVWFSFVFGLIGAAGLSLLPLDHGQVLYSSITFNFFYALVLSSTLRDQMGCAMTCFLPDYVEGASAKAMRLGLGGNLFITLLVLVSPQVAGSALVEAAIFNFFMGLAFYFLVFRIVLVMENSNWIMMSTPFLWVLSSLNGAQLEWISAGLYQFFWVAPLLAVLAWWAFSRAMKAPGLQRRILEVPYGDPSLGGSENLEELEQRKQLWRDRKTQDLQRVRLLSTLRLPFRAGVFRYLELLIGRSLLWLLRSEMLVIVLLLTVLKPLISWSHGAEMLALLYPSIYVLYILNALPLTASSPLLPVSRGQRISGILLLNLSTLFLFVMFIGLTTFVEGQFVPSPGFALHSWSTYTMAFILTAPLFFIAQLLMGMAPRHVIGLLIVSFMIIVVCWTICVQFVLGGDAPVSRFHGFFMISGIGWLLYLVLLWWRFTRMNLEK